MGIYLQACTECSLVSIWPSTGHLVPCGCQFAKRTPNESLDHRAIYVKSLSHGGTCSADHAFHTFKVFALGGGV